MSEPVTEVLGPGGFQVGVGGGGPPADTPRLHRPPATPPTRPAPPPAPHGTPAPGEWVGRFEVERELGRGGAGVVLLARDRGLDRPVALKLLWADDAHTLARFRLEANALAGLTHPNAVRVYEFGGHAGRPYLAMEYVAGRSLSAALRDGPIDPRRAAGLVAAVAGAVAAAHAAGVVHRDVKPANVLLDAADAPKLSDFGVAKHLAGPAGLTQTNAVVGTPAYMAPEQAAGRAADARTDVYGLGATLYECLTGRPPFVGPALEVLKQVADDEPVPPGRLNRAVPRDLETVCLKCLDKDPARRYPSAAEVAADLGRVLRGEPVHARRTGAAERAVKWVRRHKPVTAMAALAVVSLVGGAVAAGWQAVRATAARDAEAGLRQFAEAKADEADAERANARAAEAAALGDKRRAEEKADEATAINAFLLEDLLQQASSAGQADAQHKPDPNLTMRVALDRAASKVVERFRGRPATEEAVRVALGDAYRVLADPGKAIDQLRPALESRRARLGPDHPEALDVMGRLALAYGYGGRVADAVPLLEERLERSRRALGPDHPNTLTAMSGLGLMYSNAGRHAEALPLQEAAARGLRGTNGPDDPAALTALVYLGVAYHRGGRQAEALPLFEEAHARRRRTLGPEHPATLSVANTLGMVYTQAGRAGDAAPILEDCLRLRRGQLGPTHPDAVATAVALADALALSGRPDDSVPLYKDALRLRRQSLGPAHPYTLIVLGNLAHAHYAAGRPADAVPLYEELTKLRAARTPPDPQAADARRMLGICLLGVGRYAEAEPRLLADDARLAADPKTTADERANARRRLAELYTKWGKPAEAAKWGPPELAPLPRVIGG